MPQYAITRPFGLVALAVLAVLAGCKDDAAKKRSNAPTAAAQQATGPVGPGTAILLDSDLPTITEATTTQPATGPIRSTNGQWEAYTEARPGGVALVTRPIQPKPAARKSDAVGGTAALGYFWFSRGEGTMLAVNNHSGQPEESCSIYSPGMRRGAIVCGQALRDFRAIDVAHVGFTRQRAAIQMASPDGQRLLLELSGEGGGQSDRRFYVVRTDSGEIFGRFNRREAVPRDWWKVIPPTPPPATQPATPRPATSRSDRG